MKKLLTIKQLRELSSYSQSEIADKLGITQPAYSNFENGNSKTDIKNYLFLSELFEVDVEYIMKNEIPVFIYLYNNTKKLDVPVENVLKDINEIISRIKNNNYL